MWNRRDLDLRVWLDGGEATAELGYVLSGLEVSFNPLNSISPLLGATFSRKIFPIHIL